jgi:hypothetical protein
LNPTVECAPHACGQHQHSKQTHTMKLNEDAVPRDRG